LAISTCGVRASGYQNNYTDYNIVNSMYALTKYI